MIEMGKPNPFPPTWGPQSGDAEKQYAEAHNYETPKQIHRWYDSTIPLWTTWDVVQARSALDAHTIGNFYMSSLLYDEMRSYEALDSALKTRVLGVNGRKMLIMPNPNAMSRKQAEKACDLFKERSEDLITNEFISQTMVWSEGLGFSAAQIVWNTDERRWWPNLHHWQNALTYFMTTSRKYIANTMEGPAPIEAGDGQWVLHTPFGFYRGWLGGAVRCLAMPWLAAMYAQRDWMRFSEVHGLPIKKLKIPSSADQKQKVQFESIMTQLSNESVVSLPQNVSRDGVSWDVELMEATSQSWESFQAAIDKYEKRFAIRILGQNLTTDVEAGSLAAANVHDRVRLDFVKSDVLALSETINKQILVPWAKFNFGDERLAPLVSWEVTPVEDIAAKAAAEASAAQALASFAQAGAPIDMEDFLVRHGVRVLKADPSQEKAKGQIFQYHLDYGIVTTNEMRSNLGLPPLPDGDKPPQRATPEPQQGQPGGQQPGQQPAQMAIVAEETGVAVETPKETVDEPKAKPKKTKAPSTKKGVVLGHQYIDKLVDEGKATVATAIKPTLDAVVAAVKDAKSFDEIESTLKAMAGKLDSKEMQEAMANGLVLAHLAGKLSVHEDHPTDSAKQEDPQ